jgi:hypothetical protein
MPEADPNRPRVGLKLSLHGRREWTIMEDLVRCPRGRQRSMTQGRTADGTRRGLMYSLGRPNAVAACRHGTQTMSTHLPDFEGTSIEQLAELSGSEGRCELVRGELRMMSPAGGRHGQVAMQCGPLLANHVETHGLGVVYAAETGFILARDPDTVRAPDVAYRSADDITVLRGTEELAADDVVPAWRVRVERLLG